MGGFECSTHRDKSGRRLDLIASTPGTYEAPATSAYLYYTPEDKTWVAPVKTAITP